MYQPKNENLIVNYSPQCCHSNEMLLEMYYILKEKLLGQR